MRRALVALVLVGAAGGLAVVTTLSWRESSGEGDTYAVAAVPDGDTIVLADGRRVRLAQIDAPELSEAECHAQNAQAALASALPLRTSVSLVRDPRLDDVDRFGRLIRYVVVDETNVNVELVQQGAASVWFVDGDRGRHAPDLLNSVRKARRSRLGLWGRCPGTVLDTSRGVRSGVELESLPRGSLQAVPGARSRVVVP